MKKYKHKSKRQYIEAQKRKYQRKINRIWCKPAELQALADYVLGVMKPESIMCHGVRTGFESEFLGKALNCEYLGTDIAGARTLKIRQWDFHDVKQEWVGAFDLIYSNTLDHAYSPEKALKTWRNQLKPNGILALHRAGGDRKKIDAADCFKATHEEYRELLKQHFSTIVDLEMERPMLLGHL